MKRHRLNDLPSADDALIPPVSFVEPGASPPVTGTAVPKHKSTDAPKHEGSAAREHDGASTPLGNNTNAREHRSTEAPESGGALVPQRQSTEALPPKRAAARKRSGTDAPKRGSTNAPRRESAKAPDSTTGSPPTEGSAEAGRLHVSTYLTPDIVKRVEEVRFRLRVERGQKKISKADVIERALRIGLEDIDELASA